MPTEIFPVHNFTEIKAQLLTWANGFGSCAFLDNHQYQGIYQFEECLVGAGITEACQLTPDSDIAQLQDFINQNKGCWLFGHLGYGLHQLLSGSKKPSADDSGFDTAFFFVPAVVVRLQILQVEITAVNALPGQIWQQILATSAPVATPANQVILQPAVSKQQYINTVNRLKEHIHRGDCYEMNFCQHFFSPNTEIHPAEVYHKLSIESPNPFSCFYKNNGAYLLCASPERYISRQGSHIFSQPIKGTVARGGHWQADRENIKNLRESAKERSENVMVVDLVRNDFSKICKQGSVRVDELFGIYTFPHVHQMISTISGELEDETTFLDILRATFPMGSMTGAPKKRVMELIEQYETGNRGIFSGAVGYIAPGGNFDFNVVIRSLLYNAASKKIMCWVGSGITWYSQAQEEYEECQLKVLAIKKVLETAGRQ
jgi:para-aminobenzoate synthetase component 1